LIIEADVGDGRQTRWKSEFVRELTPAQKFSSLLSNKAFIYLLMAAFFRFAGGYSLGFWAKAYFSGVYPEHDHDFTIAYFLILLFGSVPSELIGGYICDKYEPQYPSVKGNVSAAGAFLGSICIIFTFLVRTSFWTQMAVYYFEYLFAEVFFGPSYAQINKIIQSQI